MRIALVANPYIPVPPTKYGGTEQVIYYLIKGLLEEGHEPILLAPADSEVPCELIPIATKAISFPDDKAGALDLQKKVSKIERTTAAALNKIIGRVDIVHSHGFDLSKFANMPNLTTLHGPIGLDNISVYMNRKNLYYISISNNQQLAFPDLNYIDVVYNGEDPSKFPIVDKPDAYLCFLGRFDRDKNPHLAIQLAISLGMRIKIAGKIDYLGDGYFQDEVEPYINHPLVEYLGEINFEEKVELLSKAACNLHPTNFREPFGLTVIEAAYCGTPTLAINRGSMSELIENGRTGLLIEDFVEGYHKLPKCFEMDRLYIAKRARTLFNYKNMAKQYIKAYENVIGIFAKRATKKLQIIEDLERQKDELSSWQGFDGKVKNK